MNDVLTPERIAERAAQFPAIFGNAPVFLQSVKDKNGDYKRPSGKRGESGWKEPANWYTFDEVKNYPHNIGVCTTGGLIGLDFDHFIDDRGNVNAAMKSFLDREILGKYPPSYTERSNSKKGFHVLYRVDEIPEVYRPYMVDMNGKEHVRQRRIYFTENCFIEIFAWKQYVALTGDFEGIEPRPIADGGDILKHLFQFCNQKPSAATAPSPGTKAPEGKAEPAAPLEVVKTERRELKAVPAVNESGYPLTLQNVIERIKCVGKYTDLFYDESAAAKYAGGDESRADYMLMNVCRKCAENDVELTRAAFMESYRARRPWQNTGRPLVDVRPDLVDRVLSAVFQPYTKTTYANGQVDVQGNPDIEHTWNGFSKHEWEKAGEYPEPTELRESGGGDEPERGTFYNADRIGQINPLFVTVKPEGADTIEKAGGSSIAIQTLDNLPRLFNALDARAAKGYAIPCAIVDVLPPDESGRAAFRDKLQPRAKALSIPIVDGQKLATCDNPEEYPDRVLELLQDVQAARDAAKEEFVNEFSSAAHVDSMDEEIRNTRLFSSTGFERLDETLDGGFYEGLYIIGAISSLGKTTFVLQVAWEAARQGRDVLFFSLEMSERELYSKHISRLTHELADREHRPDLARTNREILTGSMYERFTETQAAAIEQAKAEYRQVGCHLFIKSANGDVGADDIRAMTEKFMRVMGRKPLVIVDYLQIIKPYSDRGTDKQNTDKAVLTLKRMSKDMSLTIFAISSFNRENYWEPVSKSSFKESGTVEYSADVLIGLQYAGMDYKSGESDKARKERLRIEADERREAARRGEPLYIQLKILKSRSGANGSAYFEYYSKFNHYKEVSPDFWEFSRIMLEEEANREKADRALLASEEAAAEDEPEAVSATPSTGKASRWARKGGGRL